MLFDGQADRPWQADERRLNQMVSSAVIWIVRL